MESLHPWNVRVMSMVVCRGSEQNTLKKNDEAIKAILADQHSVPLLSFAWTGAKRKSWPGRDIILGKLCTWVPFVCFGSVPVVAVCDQ
eukprot:4864687-Amphidinium_carterae.2